MTLDERLKDVLHLQLPVSIDLEKLRQEIFSLEHELAGFEVKTGNQRLDDEFLDLQVSGIFNVVRDPKQAAVYIKSIKNYATSFLRVEDECIVTELGDKLPETVRLIREIGAIPGRCRLSKLPAGKIVPMHQHPRGRFYSEQIVHIPLYTNPEVKMIVDDVEQHYAGGEVWLFNNWHRHGVVNHGTTDRWHLWLNYYLFDREGRSINDQLRVLLQKALTGPSATHK